MVAAPGHRRWADFSSDSECSRPNPPIAGPLTAIDDSYNGPPLSTCDDSNTGLNAEMKKCVAKDIDAEEIKEQESVQRGPSDFSFLCENDKASSEGCSSSGFPRFSALRTPTPIRPVAEFYPTGSTSVFVGTGGYNKRKRESWSECKKRGHKAADQHSESTRTEDASTTTDAPDDRRKKVKTAPRSKSSRSTCSDKSDREREQNLLDKKAEKRLKQEQEQAAVDWEVRRQQRIRDVQKIQQTEEYARYCKRALVSDPREPDPDSRIGKRVWKFELERWRRVVHDKGQPE